MTGRNYRRVALVLVFIAGIASIMATSRPGHYFRDVRIEPEFRCPGTDVHVVWTLNEPAPVAVSVGATEFPPVLESSFVIPAAEIDDNAPLPTVVLAIDAKYANHPRTVPIRTIQGFEIIEVHGFSAGQIQPTFLVNVSAGKSAVIDAVSVSWPRQTRCDADDSEREISWKVIKDGKILATLLAESGYESALPAVNAAPGPWTFRYTENATDKQCRPGYWDKDCLTCRPLKVRFSIRCTE